MTKVGVARLKAQLSRYLDVAKRGEDVIIITERGRPVAMLVALRGAERTEARRERLARAGLLMLGTQRLPARLRKRPRGPLVGDAVLRALDEREQGR
jgi:prevent-host-death family protein